MIKPVSKIGDFSRAGLMLLVICQVYILHPLFHGTNGEHCHTDDCAVQHENKTSPERHKYSLPATASFLETKEVQCHITANNPCPICLFFARTAWGFSNTDSTAYRIDYPPRQNIFKRNLFIASRAILSRHPRAPPSLMPAI